MSAAPRDEARERQEKREHLIASVAYMMGGGSKGESQCEAEAKAYLDRYDALAAAPRADPDETVLRRVEEAAAMANRLASEMGTLALDLGRTERILGKQCHAAAARAPGREP